MKKLVLVGVVAVAAISLTGCKATEPFKDAPTGARNTGPADLINMPDGFSNLATKCDHGNRLYVIFKGNDNRGSVTVVPKDSTCS
jgi:hypothetical protein